MADERPRRHRGRALPTLVVLPLVLMSVWIDQGVIEVHWLIATAVIGGVILLEEFSPDPGPALHGLRAAMRRYGSGVLAVLTGAAVVFSGWTLAGWSRTRLSACEPPAELRVMAATETLRVMRARAEEFAAAQARGERCRPVHVTVFAAPPLRVLDEAFRNDWQDDNADRSPLATVGPRPDLWLASARAVADRVTGSSIRGPYPKTPAGSVSPIVLGVSPAAGLPPAGGTPDDWEEAIAWARSRGITLLRPSPESSDVAVVATTALYGPAHGDGERHDREQEVSPDDMPLAGVDEMLCGVRERLARDPELRVAVVVPAHSLNPYNRGLPLGGACTHRLSREEAQAQRLDTVRPRRTPLLDYTLVRVSWENEHDPERDRLAVALRDWLAGPQRLGEGFERPGPQHDSTVEPVDSGRLETTLSQIAATRRPRTLLFALDRSGSMKAPVSGGTAIGRAREVVHEALTWLGGNDAAGLWVFPTGRDGREPTVLTGPAPDEEAVISIRAQLDGPETAAEGDTTPLHHVIAEGVRALREEPGEGSLVVLTDGGNEAGRHAADDLEELHEELRAPGGPRLYLVVVGERGCDRPLRELLADSPRSHCLDFGPAAGPRQVVGELFTDIWKD